jgi:2-keto-4-pentenoate hydratase/2-oxohepta-3-ene-1,7-dioic acid hydratase in catechol pathway
MKIICVGMNYAAHIKELNSKTPVEPVFFMKPDTSLLLNSMPFYMPDWSSDLHYEVEFVAKIGRLGKNIDVKFASRYYNECTVGIDFTARDLQRKCKDAGNPWEIAKAFDGSAALGKFIKTEKVPDIKAANIRLEKNGQIVQQGNTSDMLFTLDYIISYVSKYITLKIGDLIYTGTPPGVGPVKIGDTLEAFLEDEKLLSVNVK